MKATKADSVVARRCLPGTIKAVRDRGFEDPARNYLMFVDANVYCGIGSTRGDSQPGPENANARGGGYARVDRGCWTGVVAAHETMHNLGAVQLDAPHSTGSWHCTDECDIMCDQDGGPAHRPAEQVCTEGVWARSQLFDCNGDDYVNVDPGERSYLATHWNVANSPFLDAPRTASEATPQLALSRSAGAPGTLMRANATGFPPGRTVRLTVGEVEVAAAKANRKGAATLPFEVPAAPGGEHRVHARVDTDKDTAAGRAGAEAGFTIVSTIALDPLSAAPGEPVTVRGAGFGAWETVGLAVGDRPVAAARAGADGTLEATFVRLDDAEAGSHVLVVVASGDAGHATSASLGLRAPSAGGRGDQADGEPALWLSLGSGMPGEWIRAWASGLRPGETVKLRFGDQVMTGGKAGRDGTVSLRFRVLPRPGGEYAVTASAGEAWAEARFRLAPALAVEAKTHSPGRPAKVRLLGFAPEERVRFLIGEAEVGAGEADEDGQLRAQIAVPVELSAGGQTLRAIGDAGSEAAVPLRIRETKRQRGRVVERERTPVPDAATGRISLSLDRGSPHTPVRVSLAGFPSRERVRIRFGGRAVTSAPVNGAGNGSVGFEAPELPGGEYPVTAEPGGAMAATFRIEPGLDLAAKRIAPGARIEVVAEGFGRDERIAFTVGGEEIGTATAGSDGTAKAQLTLPDDLPEGAPVLVAEGRDGGRATVSLREREGRKHGRGNR